MIPKNFEYLDSFVLPKHMQESTRALSEHITEENRYKYFLELKNRRETLSHISYKPEDFPVMRLIYILVWKDLKGNKQFFKVGCSQKCYQRIGSNYLAGTGANTGWLSPAMYSFLREYGGEFEIYYRAFDEARVEMDNSCRLSPDEHRNCRHG